MSGDDGLPGGVWRIDDEVREEMRVARIEEALRLEQWDAAVVEAEELLDESPSHPDGLFLLGEALLHVADFELARRCYEQRLALHGAHVESMLGIAVAAFQSCDVDTATAMAQDVVQRAPDLAEAHFYLGLSLEHQPGRATEAWNALAAANQLAPDRFPLPRPLDEEGWRRVIYRALQALHPLLQRFYVGMDFRLEDLPSLEELRAHDIPLPPTVAAMYVGTPPAVSAEDTAIERPVAMRLFTRNLGRSLDEDHLVDQLGLALHDEALHWLGMTEQDLVEE